MTRDRWALAWAVCAAAAVLCFSPLLGSRFFVVTFDDDAFIIDNPAIRALTPAQAINWFTAFYHADYVPVTLASFALDYQLWGLWPGGYHLTNLALHLLASALVGLLVARTTGRDDAAFFAGALFLLHPLQLEAVAIVAQRKTVLSGVFALLSLLAYRRYQEGAGRGAYALALAAFAAGGLAKSSIAPLPALLVLLDWAFAGRARWRDKIPFALVAVAIVAISVASKAEIGVIKPPHGGSRLASALLMGRVWLEYLVAMVLPVGLSPAYYYRPASAFSPGHLAATVIVAALHLAAWIGRRRWPRPAFALFWFTIAMLPVANLVPIAVVRGDRYVYLAMVGPVWWAGEVLARAAGGKAARSARADPTAAGERAPRSAIAGPTARVAAIGRRARALVPYAVLAALALTTWRGTAVWADDVSIWEHVVDRHPWNARAHYLLGHAYNNAGARDAAENALLLAVEQDPQFADAHLLLAAVLWRAGDTGRARHHLQQGLALAPHTPVPEFLRPLLEEGAGDG